MTPGIGRPLGWLAAALLLAGAGYAQTPQIKIAVVDLEAVVAQSQSGKALQEKLAAFQESVRSEVEQINERARDIRQRIADGANTLSEDKLNELQKQYEDEQIKLRRLRDDKTREAQKMQEEGLREIEKQLAPVFKGIQEELGYDLIINNVPGVVVMANEKVDITKLVVERLNASVAGGGGEGAGGP